MLYEALFPAKSSDTTDSVDIPGGATTAKEKLPSIAGLACDARRLWMNTETRQSSESVFPVTVTLDATSSPVFGENTARCGAVVSTTTIPLLNAEVCPALWNLY